MTTTSLIIGCVCFALGYLTGRLDTLLGLLRGQQTSAPQGFFAKTDARPLGVRATNIEIDERKVVTPIDTGDLQQTKKIQLGKQSVQFDNLEASVNKLAQLKRS